MPKGVRLGGRKKGTPNKVTASMREAWRLAFDEMGGVTALVKRGKANKTEFYRAVTKLIPQDITSGGKAIGLMTEAERQARVAAILAGASPD